MSRQMVLPSNQAQPDTKANIVLRTMINSRWGPDFLLRNNCAVQHLDYRNLLSLLDLRHIVFLGRKFEDRLLNLGLAIKIRPPNPQQGQLTN